jgi:Skp family chaperone for outer membrane proteins
MLVAIAPASAQERAARPDAEQDVPGAEAPMPRSSVVVLDRDALFARSLFGRRVTRDIEAATQALAAENRKIEQALEAEERVLTERRGEMETAAFRELAAEFDARVNDIRETQLSKERAIRQQGERAQALFLERANPILVELARETGALVILDRRIVIASADQVDITDLARTRIDEALGDGADLEGGASDPPPADGALPRD